LKKLTSSSSVSGAKIWKLEVRWPSQFIVIVSGLSCTEASISTLKQLAVSKGLQLPSLNLLIPFLEASTNQEYLVYRIKHLCVIHIALNSPILSELAKGGCMSSFKWNGGGMFKGKAWEEHLPSDACVRATCPWRLC
jgi:hypothetical protein